MIDTRHYLDTLDEAVKAYVHWQQTAQQLIDEYGDNEMSNIIKGEYRQLAELDISNVDDEACDNSELWIKRVIERRAVHILEEAKKAVTGDSVEVMGNKSKKELDNLKRQITRCYNDFGRMMMQYDKQPTHIYRMKLFDNSLPENAKTFKCDGKIHNSHELHRLMIDENAIPFDVEFDYFVFCVLHAEYGRMVEASQSKNKVRVFASIIGNRYFDRTYKQASAQSMGCSVSNLTKHKDRQNIRDFCERLNKIL